MITKETLVELRKLSAEATPNWLYLNNGNDRVPYVVTENGGTLFESTHHGKMRENTDIAILARNNIDALLDLIELQQSVVEAAEEHCFGEIDLDCGERAFDNLMKALQAYREKKV